MLKNALWSALVAAIGTLIIWFFTHTLWALVPGVLLFLGLYLLLSRKSSQEERERALDAMKPTQIIDKITAQADVLSGLANDIENPQVKEKIGEIQAVVLDIASFLRDNPDKVYRLKGLQNHYLPDLIKALGAFQTAEKYDFCDSEKLLEYLEALRQALKTLLKQLLQDTLSNMEVTMGVAMRLLEESGLMGEGKIQ